MITESEEAPAKARSALRDEPHLFVAVEGARPGVGASRHSLANVEEVLIGRADGRSVRRAVEEGKRRLVLGVPDARMSAAHARITRGADGGWTYEDLGSRNGSRMNGEAITSARLPDGALLELGRTLFLFRAAFPVSAVSEGDRSTTDLAGLLPGLATLIPSVEAGLAALSRVAEKSDVPILLLGETGTGKEVLARTIHKLSGRPGELVAVNCGALPEALVESMLFGHKRGAFSGAARDELGFVRSADKGTLFLDEIGDLPRASQAALLRVLQEREVVPVGSVRPEPVDIRVVAATHAPLEAAAERGDFRSDLYARIAGYVHALPPLRQRKEDIGLLVAALLHRLVPAGAEPPGFGPDVARALYEHDWPRNVRELAQSLSVALVLARDGRIERPHLGLREKRATSSSGGVEDEAALRESLLARLEEHQGNVTQVARSMGKARMQIQRWMKRFNIDPAAYRK